MRKLTPIEQRTLKALEYMPGGSAKDIGRIVWNDPSGRHAFPAGSILRRLERMGLVRSQATPDSGQNFSRFENVKAWYLA